MEKKYIYFQSIPPLKIHQAWIILKSVTFAYVDDAIFISIWIWIQSLCLKPAVRLKSCDSYFCLK